MARNIAIYHKCNALVSLKCDHIRSTVEIRTIHPSQVEARHNYAGESDLHSRWSLKHDSRTIMSRKALTIKMFQCFITIREQETYSYN